MIYCTKPVLVAIGDDSSSWSFATFNPAISILGGIIPICDWIGPKPSILLFCRGAIEWLKSCSLGSKVVFSIEMCMRSATVHIEIGWVRCPAEDLICHENRELGTMEWLIMLATSTRECVILIPKIRSSYISTTRRVHAWVYSLQIGHRLVIDAHVACPNSPRSPVCWNHIP